MTQFLVRRQWQKRVGKSAEKAQRTWVESYLVQTNNLLADEIEVLTAPGIPFMYAPFVAADGTFDLTSTVRDLTTNNREDSPYFWDVIVNYSNKTDDPQKNNPDPLQRRPTYNWTNQLQTVISTTDLNGNAIVNSAGEKFSDPPEGKEKIAVFNMSRTENVDPNPGLASIFLDAVNENTFLGIYPPTYAWCTKLDSKERYENGRYYYDAEYSISCRHPSRPYGWQPAILDEGMHTKDPKTGKPRAIFDETTGQPIQSPVLLDGNGQLLANASASLKALLTASATAGNLNTPVPSWLLNHSFPLVTAIGSETVVLTSVAADGTFTVTREVDGEGNPAGVPHAVGTVIPTSAIYLTFVEHPLADFNLLNLFAGI